MAAHPIVVIDHGKVEIPAELQDDPRFRDGAKLQLVPVAAGTSSESAQAWENFRKLRGILANSSFDPNAELEKDRLRELEDEARWLRE